MKKILLPLFLLTTSMGITKLSAYCFYNRADGGRITFKIYTNSALTFKKNTHTLRPKGNRACWNWKEIDEHNRRKEWFWVATKGGNSIVDRWNPYKIGSGWFPIGGAVVFKGYDENDRAIFKIYYKSKTWKWRRSPWNHRRRPWTGLKRTWIDRFGRLIT